MKKLNEFDRKRIAFNAEAMGILNEYMQKYPTVRLGQAIMTLFADDGDDLFNMEPRDMLIHYYKKSKHFEKKPEPNMGSFIGDSLLSLSRYNDLNRFRVTEMTLRYEGSELPYQCAMDNDGNQVSFDPSGGSMISVGDKILGMPIVSMNGCSITVKRDEDSDKD